MSQTKAQLVSGTTAQDLTVDNINTTSINSGQTGRKNFIINGACAIDQRNGGAAVTSGYAIDRTHIEGFSGGGTGTAQRVTDSPSGFYYSLKVTVTGTDTSLAAADFYTLRHIIEGSNIAHLGFGASGGTSVTLSFFVKSSVTGTFCAGLGNGSNNRTMPKEYTINATNTWEKKTLTFPADTTGTWGADANRGFSIRWCMGCGSTRQGTADQYNGGESHGTSNQTNLFATNAATFQITGLQLEAGTTATDFEHRSIGEELALCQRYYYLVGSQARDGNVSFNLGLGALNTSNSAFMHFSFPTEMRATPTLDHTNGADYYRFFNDGGGANLDGAFTIWNPTRVQSFASCTLDSSLTAGGAVFGNFNDNSAKLGFSAEL